MYNEDSECIIKYSKYFTKPQVSLKPIRLRQDEKLATRIFDKAKTKLDTKGYNVAKDPLFFVGSVDFMVKNENGKKTFYVLETNGGNSRGFSALPAKHWKESNKSYAQSLSYVKNKKPVVIIGHPGSDLLLYEKIALSEEIVSFLKEKGVDAEAVSVDNLDKKRLRAGGLVIIGPYEKILPKLSIDKDNYVCFDGKKADVLIGDGIARRKPEITEHLLKNNLKSLVVNDVFFITDDKALTYLAVEKASQMLEDFNVEPIAFKRVTDKNKLKSVIEQVIDKASEVLIKPHGGSGGSGIDIIYNKKHIEPKIRSSIEHYYEKFGTKRDPFPYTVCQRVHATPIKWKNKDHHFDIRVYVGRDKDKIVPLGVLMRVALEPFAGRFVKKSFVVNLSGYEGVDTDRGFGLHKDYLKLFNLSEDDFAQISAAACATIAYINNNYCELLNLAFKNEET